MVPARVTLTVIEGHLPGQRYVIDEPLRIVLGRAPDCDVHLDASLGHQDVSRHHCLLAFEPPAIWVRDLGSRNGTFLNGVLIGQRPKNESAADSNCDGFLDYDLHDGDVLRLGNVLFRVDVDVASELTPHVFFAETSSLGALATARCQAIS